LFVFSRVRLHYRILFQLQVHCSRPVDVQGIRQRGHAACLGLKLGLTKASCARTV